MTENIKDNLRKQELRSTFEPTPHRMDDGIRRRVITTHALHQELYTRGNKTTGGHKKKLRACREAGNYFAKSSFEFIHSTDIYSSRRSSARHESRIRMLRSDFATRVPLFAFSYCCRNRKYMIVVIKSTQYIHNI